MNRATLVVVALAAGFAACDPSQTSKVSSKGDDEHEDLNRILERVGSPAAVTVPGFEHIFWQKVNYSQGACPVELSAIFYWSPSHVRQSQGDEFYTPVIFFHGGGWAGSATFEAPQDTDAAAEIDRWVSRGLLYAQPTYRGQRELAEDPSIGTDCEHSFEILGDAESIIDAIRLRDPAIPSAELIRPNQKLRLSGGSAGGHVAMGIAVKHPEWFDRVLTGVGIYDLGYWRANWAAVWDSFGERNLAECELEFGQSVSAKTKFFQVGSFDSFVVAQQNCARVAILYQPGGYRIADASDPTRWAEVAAGTFVERPSESDPAAIAFFDESMVTGNPTASSEPDGQWPTMNRVVIEELSEGSVPVREWAEAKELFVAPNRSAAESLFSGMLNQPFLELGPSSELLAAHSFGEIVKRGTGAYPAFRLTTNTGDFALQEQALSFCNDIQESEGLPVDKRIGENGKGTIFQCGDRGTLLIARGGHHLQGTPHSLRQSLSNFYWFTSDIDPRHSTKILSCRYSAEPPTSWHDFTDGFIASWDGRAISTDTVDEQTYASEWDAVQNDPLYFGSDVQSVPGFVFGAEIIFTPGKLKVDGGPFGRLHEICVRSL